MKRRFLPLMLVAFLSGCSPTRQIVRSTHQVDELAAAIQTAVQAGIADYEAGADPRPPLRRAYDSAGQIRARTASLREVLPAVQDRPTSSRELLGVARLGLLAILVVAGVVALWRLGIDRMLRPILWRLGLWIGRATRTDAKFDAESLAADEVGPIQRERIAARRAADAAYDRAFRNAMSQAPSPAGQA